MMRRILGAPGASAVSVAAMISIFAALNGSILTGSRVPYAAARDGYFFRSIGHVNERYHTPAVSILAMSAWAAVLVLSGGYRQLFTYVIFASWILYGMTDRRGAGAALEKTGIATALPHLGLPLYSYRICNCGAGLRARHSARLAA